ncbi:AI-2E family transporter [Fischerella thermalis]|uniref:AI-2E family transporter n=1 Tax=Fischerella thermalis TaxID=372787 RepID=UPI000C80706F|nr:AI-2E family transporter [Fischerella thermalis]PLZ15309.1 AI-2E family transporter [Fischerella thermalis WC114]PLZ20125.1 AI-2E family transporter [Fischerella thermalis WC1110]PLZ24136.1 AI-2E family transporter [Fischerella thermalis WC157]PLZ44675.1 AI-2E family transporter [Fischerella thermalis WC538]PLZ49056.1 AI-2E family transporter [Fischerella thermalis WC527]
MNSLENNNFWSRLNNFVLVRFLLLVASGWAIVMLLAYFEPVIVIFTFAAILAFLLSYPVKWLKRFLPHSLAVIVIFLLSIVIIGSLTITVGLTVVSQGQQLIDSLTDFLNSLVPLLERIESLFRSRNIQLDLTVIEEQIRVQAISSLVASLVILQTFLTNFVTFILIAVIAFFMLLDGGKLWYLILKLLPKHRRNRFNNIVKRNFLGFFQGQLILTLFLTSSTFIAFLLLKVPFALILSVIVGLLDIIPGIGATLGIGTITLIILSQGVWLALKVLVVCIILQQIQDNLIAPRIMQGALNLNPVVVFFALLVGARVAGLLGIFIAIPIAGVIVSMFEIDEMKSEV